MAAHSNNFIRVRLHFDYAPPAASCCRMCWLLVDLNTCRVVSDLESLIRQKFELSRRSILSLFVEDCYLPHTESIYVVRDNDCVRVKVDSVAQVTGQGTSSGSLKENGRKRQRPEAEDENEEEERKTELENGFELKKKKRKKRKESPKKDGEQQVLSEEKKKKKKKEEHKEKKKTKEPEETAPAGPSKAALTGKKGTVEEPSKSIKKPPVRQLSKQNISSSESSSSSSEEDVPPKKLPTPKPPTKTPAAPSKPALTAKKKPVTIEEQSKSLKKPPMTQLRKPNVSSSESSSSSEEDVPPKKTPTPKPPTKTPDASKKPLNSNPAVKISPPLSSSSSDSDSSSNEAVSNKKTPINTPLTSTMANGKINMSFQSTTCVQGPAALPQDSNSEEEIKLVIRRPVQQPGGSIAGGLPPWQGRGRGKARQGRRRGGAFRGCGFEFSYHGDNNQSYISDSQTNVSVVLQNGEPTSPKRDYSSMPLLAAPPQMGQNIAFKLLELTENYTPEVSEYKEAKIVSFDPTTKQIELELLNTSHAPVEPGKFDLVYQNPDGSERVEYAVARSSRVTERWDALLEPRLII